MADKVLCSGGAGFLGSHLVDHLLNLGYDVVVLDDLSGGSRHNLDIPLSGKEPGGARKDCRELAVASIVDHEYVNLLFEEYKFRYVFHCGAFAAEVLSQHIKRFNYMNNLVGSVNLINASVNYGVECFVFLSSIAVYGGLTPPMREDMTPQPADSYGLAKLTVERELALTHEKFGLDYVVFRAANVYGERQNIADRYRNVIGIFMNQILRGEPMTVFGDGKQQRAFTYVGDIVPAIAKSPTIPAARNQVFNIGSDHRETVGRLALHVAAAMGAPLNVRHLTARDEVKQAWADHSKAREVFGGLITETSLEDGLHRMAQWVRRNRHLAVETQEFAGIEIVKGLPEGWRR